MKDLKRRNHVAQYMNQVNKNSIHKNIKDMIKYDDKYWIAFELEHLEISEEEQESKDNVNT
jgi:hypothetical protein